MSSGDAVTLDDLVQELLHLNPQAIATLGFGPSLADTENDSLSHSGLNVLMRQVLTLYMALLEEPDATLRLHTEASARAGGWPDARTANFAIVLVWGFLLGDRPLKGLPPIQILEARADAAMHHPMTPVRDLRAVKDLVSEVVDRRNVVRNPSGKLETGSPVPLPEAVPSTNALVRELLGLEPRVLARRLVQTAGEPWAPRYDFEMDPEWVGGHGLNLLLWDVFTVYFQMEDHGVEEVRLMAEHDAADCDRPDATSANFATLLSCALLSNDGWRIDFFPPRPFSQERESLLRAMALEVRRSGSMGALEGFRAICNDMIHFGAGKDKGSRLHWAAWDTTAMPAGD